MSNHLSQKEERIIALVAQGLENSDIARIIGTTRDVVKNHLKVIFDKTGMWSRLELALWYLKGNLIPTMQ
jgi:DNA-binding NarL/FixJ family response regulator